MRESDPVVDQESIRIIWKGAIEPFSLKFFEDLIGPGRGFVDELSTCDRRFENEVVVLVHMHNLL